MLMIEAIAFGAFCLIVFILAVRVLAWFIDRDIERHPCSWVDYGMCPEDEW